MNHRRPPSLPLLAVLLAVLTSGCQLFGLDDREFEIHLPEIPIGPVQFQGSVIRQTEGFCPPDIAGMEGSITIPIVQGLATDLAQDQPEDQQVDLEQYRDQITGVTVRSITYAISLNTLQKDLEAINIYFGPKSAVADPANVDLDEAIAEGATLFGSTDMIPGGTTTGGEQRPVKENPDGQDKVRDFLSSFAFSTLFSTSLTLEPEDCRNLGGDLDVAVRIAVTFFVTPI